MPTKLTGTKWTLSDEFSVTGSVISGSGGVSVKAFNAAGDGIADDALAFQAAVDALSSSGGTIVVPRGTYLLSAAPSWTSKSIAWQIDPAATFSGTGAATFPYMVTNTALKSVGPYIRSRSAETSAVVNGGISALNVEMLQPATYVGQSVAAFLGASGSNSDTGANVWSLNTLVRAESGAGGTYHGIEVDVDVFSAAATTKGIGISGGGTADPDVGLEMTRLSGSSWTRGIDIYNAITGIRVRNSTETTTGIVLGSPSALTNALITGKQFTNGHDMLLLQRATDTAPTGYALRLVNAANSANLFLLGVDGSLLADSINSTNGVAATFMQVSGAIAASSAGTVRFSATTATTVGAAGSADSLPAKPSKYLVISQDGTSYKIPLYAA